MRPRGVYICEGTDDEFDELTHKLVERGLLKKLPKYENSYLCRTDPDDVARVEGRTWICTKEKYDTVPHTAPGVQGQLGQWMSTEQLAKEVDERFPSCMAGRVMFVIPFAMGPLGGPLTKYAVELTDANYVVLCMRVMTRISPKVWDYISLADGKFVRCIHSVGLPRPVGRKVINHWPCNPPKTIITHLPDERIIMSFGSGYGGNSLLGKKCLALRIAGRIAYDEGWLAEHMLVSSVTNPKGQETFFTAAFPSACGKTNLAMLESTVPGYKVQTLGDDIAWMKFDEKGELRAINPEFGFFGVAPGTNWKTNPNAMASLQKNSIFTNVAETADGGVFWQGLEEEMAKEGHGDMEITTWMGEKWHIGEPGQPAHPNSRFTAPVNQCPCLHARWDDPSGVPVSAIIFGGRRPEGVPLVYEARSWAHGVFVGAQVKSEATAAAEFKGKQIMHDPMAMRPFLGYNFGKYLQHWLDMEKAGRKMPRIFHVNWFRQKNGKFLWPGYCENVRVLDWISRRVHDEPDIGVETPIGTIPKKGSINMQGLGPVDWDELFSLPRDYWLSDAEETRTFLEQQVGQDLPQRVRQEMLEQEKRIREQLK